MAALHFYEATTRRIYNQAEADLQLFQDRRWDLAEAAGKLPAGARRPRLAVNANTRAAVNGTIIAEQFGAQALVHRSFKEVTTGDWRPSTLPNLLVTRSDAPRPSPPPGYVEYAAIPDASTSALKLFHGTYRIATTRFSEYAAYAPAGSINLDAVVGWANPGLTDIGQAFSYYTGAPAVVAAGKEIKIGDFPHGEAISLGTTGAAPISIASGLAVPRVRKLPTRPFEAELFERIRGTRPGALMHELSETAEALDDKTHFLDDEPPSLGKIIDWGRDKAPKPEPQEFFSLRSSLEFPFPTLPGCKVNSFSLVPLDLLTPYLDMEWWFHAPHPPDGQDAKSAQLREQIDKLSKEIKDLTALRAGYDIRIRKFEGGSAYTAREVVDTLNLAIPWDQSTGVFRETTVMAADRGLIARFQGSDGQAGLMDLLRQDLETLRVRQRAGIAGLWPGVKTNQDLLIWLAEFGPKGYGSPDRIPPRITLTNSPLAPWPAGFGHVADGGYRAEYLGPVLLNGLLDRVMINYDQTSGAVNCSFQATKGGAQTLKPSASGYNDISADMWYDIVLHSDPHPVNPARVQGNPAYATEIGVQIAFYEFLLDTANPGHPVNRARAILDELKTNRAKVVADLADREAELDKKFEELLAISKSLMPLSRQAQEEKAELDPKGFGDDKGLPGAAYAPYGVSWDFFIKLGQFLAKVGQGEAIVAVNRNWEPRWPVIYFGPDHFADGHLARGPEGGLRLTETSLVVPSGRTLYYNNILSLHNGDVYLQRGSTLVVKELKLTGDPDRSPFGWWIPTGRVILEAGATLVVQGNLRCGGSRARGSVVLVSPPGQAHPITASVLVGGEAFLPYGTINAMELGDVGEVLGLTAEFNRWYSFVTRIVLPNFAKLPNYKKLGGPFAYRRPFFARLCPRWKMTVPKPVPIPLLYPIKPEPDNEWVKIHKNISLVYCVIDNIVVGENFYLQCDWWYRNAGNVVNVLPKLNPRHLVPFRSPVLTPLPHLNDVPDTLTLGYQTAVKCVEQQILGGLIGEHTREFEQPGNGRTAIQGQARLQSKREQLESATLSLQRVFMGYNETGSNDGMVQAVTAFGDWTADLVKFLASVYQWLERAEENTLVDTFGRELQGVLICAQSVKIGMDFKTGQPMQPAALTAVGLIMAEDDIVINALHTVGILVSRSGSINPASSGAHTSLMVYPAFSAVSLYQPFSQFDWAPKVPHYLQRPFKVEYGSLLPQGKGLDARLPDPLRVTAEGWDQ